MKRVITFGTFDLFHMGHLNIIRRAKALGDFLIVGVSSDALNYSKKGRYPYYSESDRMEIVGSLSDVDAVFLEESLELKAQYIIEHRADILVMGNDWEGKFDSMKKYCEVTYFPRTEGISTTDLVKVIRAA